MNIGDIVRLRSGGPLMTVTSTYSDEETPGSCGCWWFDSTQQARYAQFPEEALVLTTGPVTLSDPQWEVRPGPGDEQGTVEEMEGVITALNNKLASVRKALG